MKKVVSSLIVIFLLILVLGFVSSATISEDLHVNIQTTDSSGSVVTGTFDFVFNISTASDCSSVVYSNVTTLTTDIRGIISYYLPDVSLDYSEEYYLCYYRDGTLVNASKIVRTPYSFRAKNITLSGVEIDSNLDMTNYNVTSDYGFFNLAWSYLTNIPNLIYDIWDSNNFNNLFVSNGTAIGYNQTVFNNSVDSRITISEPDLNVNNSDFFDGYDSSFFMPLNTSVSGNFDFNGGWQDGGVTIDGGDIYVQTGYFYNITSLNVTKQNLTVLENFIVEGNVGIGTSNPSSQLYISNPGDDTLTQLTVQGLDTQTAVEFEVLYSSGRTVARALAAGTAGTFQVYSDSASGGGLVTIQGSNSGGYMYMGTVTDFDAYSTFGAFGNVFNFQANGRPLNFRSDTLSSIIYAHHTTGNVGIGMTSPTEKLMVNGSLRVQNSSGTLALYVNDSTGYIGIGTVTPQQKLNVIGDLNFTGELIGNYGTYNSTYDTWAYNMSSPYDDYNYNMSDGSFNSTYHKWSYNQTYTDGTYNSTYDTWAYNQTSSVDTYWNVSGSNLFPYDLSKNVGIGTSSPTGKLHVNGSFFLDVGRGDVYFEDNSNDNSDGAGVTLRASANPTGGSIFAVRSSGQAARLWVGQTFTTTGNNDFYVGSSSSTTANDTSLYSAKIGRTSNSYFNTNGGNVGIGTSSPSAKLDVEVSSGGAATIGSSLNTATGDYAVAMGINTNASGTYSTAMGFETIASGFATIAMGYQTTSSGYSSTAMGYQTTASENYATAMGYRTNAFGYSSTAMGYYTNSSGFYSTTMGGSTTASGYFSTAIGSSTTASGFATTAMGREIDVSGDYSFGISLDNPASDYLVTGSNVMAIMGGDVGIGTSSPNSTLEVYTGATNVAGGIVLSQGEANSGRLFFVNGTAGKGFTIMKGGDNLNFMSGSEPGQTSGSTKMVMTSDGDVGIGTTAPTQKLDVRTNDALGYAGYFFNDGNTIDRYGVRIQAGQDADTGRQYYFHFFDGDGSFQGGLQNDAVGSMQLYDASDERLKTNIQNAPTYNTTKIIDGLQLRNFNMVDFDGKVQGKSIGFVAQELQKVFPEMVVPMPKEDEKDEQMFGVESNTQLTFVLLQSVKELKTENDLMKIENDLLKTELCSRDNSYSWC